MSRHDIEAKEPDVWVTVGWDKPLQTYFAQVFRSPELIGGDADDEELVWRGFGRAAGDEIIDVNTIRSLVAPYITRWPEYLDAALVSDREAQR